MGFNVPKDESLAALAPDGPRVADAGDSTSPTGRDESCTLRHLAAAAPLSWNCRVSQRTKEQLPRPLHLVDLNGVPPLPSPMSNVRPCGGDHTLEVVEFLATLCRTLFAGAAVYIDSSKIRTHGLRHEGCCDRMGSKLQMREGKAGFTRDCEFPRGRAGAASRRGHLMLVARDDLLCRAFYIHRSHANEPLASCAGAGSGVGRDPSVVGGVGQAARCSQRSEPGGVGGIYGTFVQGLTTLAANAPCTAEGFRPRCQQAGCRND